MKWDGTSNGIVCNLGTSYYNLYINHYHMSINTGHGDYVGFTFPSGTYIDQWIHVAVVFYNGTPSPENVAIYVNGERKDSG